MAQVWRFRRACAPAGLLLAASFLFLPASASSRPDDLPLLTGTIEPPSATPPDTPGLPTTASPPTETVSVEESPPPTTEADTPTPTATAAAEASPTEAASQLPGEETTVSATAESPTPTVEASSPLGATMPTEEPTPFPSPTDTPSPTSTPTETLAPEPHLALALSAPASFAPGSVLINEVAWSGTEAFAVDEWIELWNPGSDPIDLAGWVLTDSGDIRVELSGEIAAYGFYLLERTDDTTVSDIGADRIYTGSLRNEGEALELIDPSGALIDTANAGGGAWPAGSTEPRRSMERHGLLDVPGSWGTFAGVGANGLDAEGSPIGGTPRQANAPLVAPIPTATATPTDVFDAAPFPAGAVLINEVAWSGTLASSSDEWIELFNPGDQPIDLTGWTLTDDGDIEVALRGSLDAGGYYLLERTADSTISDISADLIYTGSLSNDGERLRLVDPTGAEIHVVNEPAGAWAAGDASKRSSMERGGGAWHTFTGFYGRGRDADGRAVGGTPRGPNSVLFPTPMPTWIPGEVVVNEVLIRPRYDWEGAGGVTTADEFIELYNRGPGAVRLAGWTLDDHVVGGSKPYELPSMTLEAGSFAVFFRSRTRIALNDDGASIRLSAPDGRLVDKVRYLRVRAANLSYGRLPDGDQTLVYGLWPTPGEPNRLYDPPGPFPPGTMLIHEVAWGGTLASSSDEWIELFNPGGAPVNLFGWVLTDGGDIEVHLSGVLPPGGFYLMERSSDSTIADRRADRVYSGALSNDGERLRLVDPSGAEVDIVEGADGWPAGEAASRSSMERAGPGWATFAGLGIGRDASGLPIRGTPGAANAAPGVPGSCVPETSGPPTCP